MTVKMILPFKSELAASAEDGLGLVGGKGANLAKLAQAGFPVPDGFLVTTRAYRDYVEANQLEACINDSLPKGDSPAAETLERASETIRAAFGQGKLPAGLAEELLDSYHNLSEGPVAVRSSATAEDLPEMSFAGQQDTYLNVLGNAALLKAVVDCWSSLWTARAIGYRQRNHVPHDGAALAVVVQRMVESQASGVLFTANPLSGRRTETVIDATFGLGEALVSGQVEPDHYVVDTASGKILEKTLGAKTLSIHGQSGGGTQHVSAARKDQQALPDAQILALAQMGQHVAAQYGTPQDIEWAWADGQLYLLQSRAITSLFPTPEGVPPQPLKIFMSFAAIQGMMDPVTPVGRDTMKWMFAGGARIFNINVTSKTQNVIHTAGERLWVNDTTIFRNSVGRKFMRTALEFIEPTMKQAVVSLWDEPGFLPERNGIRPHAVRQLLHGFIPIIGNVLLNMISPAKRREQIVGRGEQVLEMMRGRIAGLHGTPRERLAAAADFLPELAIHYIPSIMRQFVSVVASGMASLNALRVYAGAGADQEKHYWGDLVLEATRGLAHNPTTQMDLDLWATAKAIKKDAQLLAEFRASDARTLAARYQARTLPPNGQAVIAKFLSKYGGRGLCEIDLGRERWFDDPTHVFEVISSYLQIDQPEMAPDVIFAKGETAAQAAIDQLAARARKQRGGWLRAHLVRFFARRVRELMGARESPKFFVVRLCGMLRAAYLNIGQDLAASGDLDQADDLLYLSFDEMKAFALNEPRDWKQLIAGRREAYQRELLRRQIPRVLLSDGRAFYEGIQAPAGDGSDRLHGSPVSPGRAEGLVRVVLDPREANLKPGEILVCPGTDPSWTPLFLSAAGLVMEVGGMMTHGAVVAREYGIPAIVGVDQVTRRLETGQRIRIDGSSGLIELLDEAK